MNPLTDHQMEALNAYAELQAAHPELFAHRSMRPIVTDRAQLEAYAAQTGAVPGVAAKTGYFLFVSDLVQPAAGDTFVYSRLISARQLLGGTNVAVLAVIADASLAEPGSVVLVEQERHATGKMEIAIPRGFAEAGQDGPTAALRELQEESGYVGAEAEFLGESVIDSGAGDALVSFYRIQVTSLVESAPEAGEAIRKIHLVAPGEIQQRIASGAINDGFTLQAMLLAQIRDTQK